MIFARLATAPASTLAAAGGAADPTEDVVDQTLNRVLIVKAHTPEELNTWLNRLAQTVSHQRAVSDGRTIRFTWCDPPKRLCAGRLLCLLFLHHSLLEQTGEGHSGREL
jgi:hypothetical protein